MNISHANAAAGVDWFVCGWRRFKENWTFWLVMIVVMMAVLLVLSLVPLLGAVAAGFLGLVMLGGVFRAARTEEEGGSVQVGILFWAFQDQEKLRPLLILGLLQMLFQMLIGAMAVALVGSRLSQVATLGQIGSPGFPAAAMDFSQLFSPGLLLGFLMVVALGTLVSMAFVFAVPLVVLDGQRPVDALKLSLAGCWQNLGALAVFGLIYILATVVAAIPFGLGLLILLPVTLLALYCAYQDLYRR